MLQIPNYQHTRDARSLGDLQTEGWLLEGEGLNLWVGALSFSNSGQCARTMEGRGPSHSVPHAKATEGDDDAEDDGGCDTLGPVPRLMAGCAFASPGFCALGVSYGPPQSGHLTGSAADFA